MAKDRDFAFKPPSPKKGLHASLKEAGFTHHDEGGGEHYFERGTPTHYDHAASILHQHGFQLTDIEHQGTSRSKEAAVHFFKNSKGESASMAPTGEGHVDNINVSPPSHEPDTNVRSLSFHKISRGK